MRLNYKALRKRDRNYRGNGNTEHCYGSSLHRATYHQQHQYAPPTASHQTLIPDMAILPLGLGFGTICAAAALQSLHADSRIPILRKHRLLRPIKFRGSFLSFFRIPI